MIKIQQKGYFQSIEQFHIFKNKQLGNGSFGVVCLAVHIKTGKVYALKIIKLYKISSQSQITLIQRENKIHSKLDHPHIVKLWDSFIQSQNLYMVMDYVEKGSLFHYQNTRAIFPQIQAFKYFYQTTKAVLYLHNNDIIHRDIKPQNLLIDAQNNIKLCDFGWSTNHITSKRNTFCGTYQYMAPQMIFQRSYDYRIDIWALGVLLYQLLHGYAPFKGQGVNQVKYKMKIGQYNISNHISQQCRQLIITILKFQPQQRISLKQILKHRWVSKMQKVLAMHYLKYQNSNIHMYVHRQGSKQLQKQEQSDHQEQQQQQQSQNEQQQQQRQHKIITHKLTYTNKHNKNKQSNHNRTHTQNIPSSTTSNNNNKNNNNNVQQQFVSGFDHTQSVMIYPKNITNSINKQTISKQQFNTNLSMGISNNNGNYNRSINYYNNSNSNNNNNNNLYSIQSMLENYNIRTATNVNVHKKTASQTTFIDADQININTRNIANCKHKRTMKNKNKQKQKQKQQDKDKEKCKDKDKSKQKKTKNIKTNKNSYDFFNISNINHNYGSDDGEMKLYFDSEIDQEQEYQNRKYKLQKKDKNQRDERLGQDLCDEYKNIRDKQIYTKRIQHKVSTSQNVNDQFITADKRYKTTNNNDLSSKKSEIRIKKDKNNIGKEGGKGSNIHKRKSQQNFVNIPQLNINFLKTQTKSKEKEKSKSKSKSKSKDMKNKNRKMKRDGNIKQHIKNVASQPSLINLSNKKKQK